jgi:hypothetical protein
VILEHVGRFDDVVVDADQDHVVVVHSCPFRRSVTLTASDSPQLQTNFSQCENQRARLDSMALTASFG